MLQAVGAKTICAALKAADSEFSKATAKFSLQLLEKKCIIESVNPSLASTIDALVKTIFG
ncbi:MAG: hypothetical protein M3033_05235 [Acidobacteriota bacterium]|nr:hypothetical protein [Acidobacteriota bacterium]